MRILGIFLALQGKETAFLRHRKVLQLFHGVTAGSSTEMFNISSEFLKNHKLLKEDAEQQYLQGECRRQPPLQMKHGGTRGW